MKIIAWTIWYPTKRFSSLDTRFEDLPRDGALAMVTFEDKLKPDGTYCRNIFKGYDYYFRADGIKDYIYACDIDSRERECIKDISARYENPIIIRGIWTDRETMQNVIDEVNSWQLTYSKQTPHLAHLKQHK